MIAFTYAMSGALLLLAPARCFARGMLDGDDAHC